MMTPINLPVIYEIRVKGHLGTGATAWFPDLTVYCRPDGNTSLTGSITDQAALHGILMQIRDLGLPLLLVRQVDDTE